jgi:hypothetical protein
MHRIIVILYEHFIQPLASRCTQSQDFTTVVVAYLLSWGCILRLTSLLRKIKFSDQNLSLDKYLLNQCFRQHTDLLSKVNRA